MSLDAMAQQPLDAAALLVEMASRSDLSGFLEAHQELPLHLQSDSLAEQFQSRHQNGMNGLESEELYLDAVVDVFQSYWTSRLLQTNTAQRAEYTLAVRLSSLLGDEEQTRSLDAALMATQVRLHEMGYPALLSPPAPLADLLIWSTERRETFPVALARADREVVVVFVDDMISAGWLEYASLGLTAASGWTDGDVLYTPSWAYDTASEAFRVSYLVHEAQHLEDFQEYPGLSVEDLEYRAKLAELAAAHKTTRRLLESFAQTVASGGTSPHDRANERVVSDMRKALCANHICNGDNRWMQNSSYTINRTANRLLLDFAKTPHTTIPSS